MKYIAIDIDGWLNGTVCRFLTKAEKSIWGDIVALGGWGDGRLGYVEASKGVPYSRLELLSLCHCFSDEDIATFDSCMKKCLDGVTLGNDFSDAPRLVMRDGIIEIVNWDSYQHSDYPKGYTEAEAKALKKVKTAERASRKAEPISQVYYDAKEKERVAKGVSNQLPTVVDALKEKGLSVVSDDTGQILPVSKDRGAGNDGI